MSQIAPTTHDPVEIEPRKMTPSRRARIIAAHGGKCAYPLCEETTGLQVDHVIALALGGRDADDNLEPLCLHHHATKTKRDLALIAKAKRRGLKHRGEFPPAKQKIRSGGFRPRWQP